MRLPIVISALLIISAPALHAQVHEGVVPGSPQLGTVALGQGGRTLIVLHGGPGLPHAYLRPLWEQLQTEGRVVFYDQRGCGLSEGAATYRWQDHVADLNRVVNHFSPGEPVILAGSSWGSTLALLYALEHPGRVEALVLSGTPTWREMAIGQVRVDSTLSRHLAYYCRSVGRATLESLREKAPLEALRGLRVRTLLISGSDDAVGVQELAPVLPNVSTMLIPGASHAVWYEQPDQFFAQVRRFLRSLP